MKSTNLISFIFKNHSSINLFKHPSKEQMDNISIKKLQQQLNWLSLIIQTIRFNYKYKVLLYLFISHFRPIVKSIETNYLLFPYNITWKLNRLCPSHYLDRVCRSWRGCEHWFCGISNLDYNEFFFSFGTDPWETFLRKNELYRILWIVLSSILRKLFLHCYNVKME